MAGAFLLLMPAAALAARHKYLSGTDGGAGRVRAGWFKAHRGAQVLALLSALTGFILIFAVFGWIPGEGRDVFGAHRAFGLISTGLALVQGYLGAARPDLGAGARRATWFRAHSGLGWAVVLLGTVTCYLGIGTVSTLGAPAAAVSAWLGTALAVTCTLLLLGGALEARRRGLIASGAYDPATHELADLAGGEAPAVPVKA
jgi:hypothetical protein